MIRKTAIILFNLGGPDELAAVEPFLFNLFFDPAIIRLPKPLRFLIALLVSKRRAKIAQRIYAQLGGGSPILKNTQAQANKLDKKLNTNPAHEYKTFIAMRYWHPFADETSCRVKSFAPDEIVLLPLYPQFSTTTTDSSLKDWHRAAHRTGIKKPTKEICCYPQQSGFIHSMAAGIRPAYDEARKYGTPRILFSAHGLPEKIIKDGDPYAAQCAMTVEALRRELDIQNLDGILCFQSRVGPLQWIGPSTDDEIRRAGGDKVPLVVVPIAFVSDHSETLVEIDIEYRHLAGEHGVPFFAFVPAVGEAEDFIAGLAQMVRDAENRKGPCLSSTGARICPVSATRCICPSGQG